MGVKGGSVAGKKRHWGELQDSVTDTLCLSALRPTKRELSVTKAEAV